MDVRWKDGAGNILNVDNEKLKYLSKDNLKTIIKKEDIKKITIEDGLMNIFTDFKDGLSLSIVIPKKNKRDAAKIFNEYDKTGKMLKRKSGNFFIDLILDSSVVTFNPFTGLMIIFAIVAILFGLLVSVPIFILGDDLGLFVSRFFIVGVTAYIVLSYVLLLIKRRRLKEN